MRYSWKTQQGIYLGVRKTRRGFIVYAIGDQSVYKHFRTSQEAFSYVQYLTYKEK